MIEKEMEKEESLGGGGVLWPGLGGILAGLALLFVARRVPMD